MLEKCKSEMTVKIKKSPSPHTSVEDANAASLAVEKKAESPEESAGEPVKKKTKRAKVGVALFYNTYPSCTCGVFKNLDSSKSQVLFSKIVMSLKSL